MNSAIIKTPIGLAKISGSIEGIVSVIILDDDSLECTQIIPKELQDCVLQLDEYFNGKRKNFCLKINPKGTFFQKKVWNELMKIPFGKTISYLQLSKSLGDTKKIRAAAMANSKNPLWVIVPCHRVIGSNGNLTGYAGGLHRKKWLLDHESLYKQQSLF